MDEATREIQQNELAALRAIFMDDYRDVETKTVWNVKQHTAEFVVQIRPTDDELKSSVSVGLHVKLPKTYPRTAPLISLEDPVGLSDTQVQDAAAVVRSQVSGLLGNEMVYELAVAVSEYITEHNSAAQAARPSFHQQMVDRERAGREAQMEREAVQRRQQQEAFAVEQEDLQRRIMEELERKQQQVLVDQQRQQHLSDIADAVNSVAGRWAEGIQLLKFDHTVYLDPQLMAQSGKFTTVALEESSIADPLCAVYDAYPTDLVGASINLSDRFTVQCFVVTNLHYLTEQGRRSLERVSARIGDLAQIRHQNMVAVYGSRIEILEERSQNPGIRIWVLSDTLSAHDGSTLEDVLESCGAIATTQVRTYLRHMLLSLVSLHAAGFIHRSIMPSNILLTKEGKRRFVAKLFNTSYREEMIGLHRITPLSETIGDNVGNDIRVAPEVVDRPDMMGRKNDIWCVGVTGLQMVLGLDALQNVAIGNEPRILESNRESISPGLFNVLSKMLTTDHQLRPTAMEILNDSFFNQVLDGEPSVHRQALDSASRGLTFELQRSAARITEGKPQSQPPPLPAAPVVVERNTAKRRPHQQRSLTVKPIATTATSIGPGLSSSSSSRNNNNNADRIALRPLASRYRTDFEEIEFVGKGGFGSVVKARNLIDGRFYAIKKIKLDPRDNEGNKKIFREVTTLSRLHHQNIVRYYTTWVEEDYESMAAGALGMSGIPEESESLLSSDDEDGDDQSAASSDGLSIRMELSHSSWSTELSTSGTDSDSSDGSSRAGGTEGGEEAQDDVSDADSGPLEGSGASIGSSNGASDDDDDDVQICFASPIRSDTSTNNGIGGGDTSAAGVVTGSERQFSDEANNESGGALESLNPRVVDEAMLAPGSGGRASNVFSAIRFGTMRAGKEGASGKRGRPSRAVMLKTYGPVREFAASTAEEEEEDDEIDEKESDSKSNSTGLGDALSYEQDAYQRQVFCTEGSGSHKQYRYRKDGVGRSKEPRRKGRRPVAQPSRKSQILYIQMEYCENKTLSDVIREGLDEKESWRLFGQILEGLHHIHERSVIHRDLKPVNAFLDGAGDIKIGDFGLATSSFALIDTAANASFSARAVSLDRSNASNAAEDALTADIGTSMYVAPEVTAKTSGAATRYNQKVDMYSLGIIFFEMCYPLKTGMERATVLHNLRKPEIVFPDDFSADRMQLQYQIIKRLLSHNPRLRPSSAELLESGLLPPKMEEDEYIRETIKTIANPSQPYFTKLMDSLFAHSTDKHIDATFDYRSNDIYAEQLNAVFLDRIRETMTRVFRIHAAVELSTPALTPRLDLLDTYQKPAYYMDPKGNVVQLPYDQTVPFARYVARTRMTEIKRYCFDRYFVANAAGGQPVSHIAASFDAVTNRSAHAVAAAEVISVVCEVFDELPAFRRMPIVLMINHMSILDAVLAYCGILQPAPAPSNSNTSDSDSNGSGSDAQFVRNVCFCLSGLYREKAQTIRQRIQVMSLTTGAKLHPHSLDRLQPFMDIRGDLGTVQREVLARIGSECGMGGTMFAARGAELFRAAVGAFNELRYVEATVRHFGVAVPITYAPLFNHHYAYYEGAYAFQFMAESLSTKTNKAPPKVLAVGGRYDGLLRRFRHLAGSFVPSGDGSAGDGGGGGDRKARGKVSASAARDAAGAIKGPSALSLAATKTGDNGAAVSSAKKMPLASAGAAPDADIAADRLSAMSFARRTGSLHSTNVWQQMYTKAGGAGHEEMERPGRGRNDSHYSSSISNRVSTSAGANAASATRSGNNSNAGSDTDTYKTATSSLGSVSIGTNLSTGSAALGTAPDVVCVGVQIHLDLVIQEMARYQQKVLQSVENTVTATTSIATAPTFGLWTRKRCDVVVASFGTQPMLKERIALARELWTNGLRTDFLFNDDPEMTMERLVEICTDQGMNWIVTLKRKHSASKYIYKVKNILRRVESEVPRDRLIEWLHTDINEQFKLDLLAHESRSAGAASSARLRAGGGAPLVARGGMREAGAASGLARVVGAGAAGVGVGGAGLGAGAGGLGSGTIGIGSSIGSSAGGGIGSGVGGSSIIGGGGGTLGDSNTGIHDSAPAGGGGGGSSGWPELTIINPTFSSKNLSRTKHKQKMMVTDRAMGSVTRVINDVKGAPVLVLDLGPELLRRLAGEPSILTDPGYKRIMELCSAHQRAHVVELRSSMERHKREGCLYVWLYSVKGDYAITYKL